LCHATFTVTGPQPSCACCWATRSPCRATPVLPFAWQDLDSELGVDVQRIWVAVRACLLPVALAVRCDELGGKGEGIELVVPVTLGTRATPAGLVGTVQSTARGISPLAVSGTTAVAVSRKLR
jgi:hypothetical protein